MYPEAQASEEHFHPPSLHVHQFEFLPFFSVSEGEALEELGHSVDKALQ